jgi:hypothetical protein
MSGIVNSIANMFRPVQQVQMAQPNPGAGAPPPPAGTSAPIQQAAPEPAPNPLDEMASLWQTDPKSPPPVDPFATPLLNTDPAKIAEAAGKMSFTGGVSQELLTKAMSGQDPAAFMQVLNAVAQRAVATSAQINASTIEQATARNNDRFQQALPSRVRQIQLDSMQSENPVLQHSASQPLLQLVRSQLQMKAPPGTSAAEINRRAEAYLTGFAGALTAPTADATAAANKVAGGTDWDTWSAT